jgi:hypothetical protein
MTEIIIVMKWWTGAVTTKRIKRGSERRDVRGHAVEELTATHKLNDSGVPTTMKQQVRRFVMHSIAIHYVLSSQLSTLAKTRARAPIDASTFFVRPLHTLSRPGGLRCDATLRDFSSLFYSLHISSPLALLSFFQPLQPRGRAWIDGGRRRRAAQLGCGPDVQRCQRTDRKATSLRHQRNKKMPHRSA